MHGIRIQDLSLNDLTQSGKIRRVKDPKNTSEETLSSVLSESESAKSNLDNSIIKEIRKDFNKLRDIFSKTETKETRKNLNEIENKLKKSF